MAACLRPAALELNMPRTVHIHMLYNMLLMLVSIVMQWVLNTTTHNSKTSTNTNNDRPFANSTGQEFGI